jgi:hypothetical protein
MMCLSIHRIYEYLEDQMPEPLKAECEAHLKECPRCRRVLEDRRRFLNAANTLSELTLPATFPLQVMARIKSRELFSGKWIRLGICAAIPLSFMLIGAFLIRCGILESWTGIIESLINIFQQTVFILAKGLKLILVFLRTMASSIGLLLEKIRSLGSLAPSETIFLTTAAFMVITAAFLLGMSRKNRIGARK